MRTYAFEGRLTALSSIAHSGGLTAGTTLKLRREKVVQPDGGVEDIPVISGNAIRGILRDIGMAHFCSALGYGAAAPNPPQGLPLPAFHFLFSGGTLTEKGRGMDIDLARKIRELLPLIGLFGGACGNAILPGKLQIGKAIPICRETRHLLPTPFADEAAKRSIWEMLQEEMYTRRDDSKDDRRLAFLAPAAIEHLRLKSADTGDDSDDAEPREAKTQMMYYIETFAAGCAFFWRIVCQDATDIEFEALLTTLQIWGRSATVGGRAAAGLGQVAVKFDRWLQIDSRSQCEGTELGPAIGDRYAKHLREKADAIRIFLHGME